MLLISRKTARTTPTLFDAAPAPDQRRQTETEETPSGLRRWQTIERIMELNATATEGYLGEFSDDSLSRYLAHLESMGSPRGARWERPGDSPAIVVQETEF